MQSFFRYLGHFFDTHWGDFVGLTLMAFGTRIIIHNVGGQVEVFAVGNSLLVTGAVLLRPKSGNSIHPEEKKEP